MTKQEAIKAAREWSRKSFHIAYVQYFHGAWSWTEMPMVAGAIRIDGR